MQDLERRIEALEAELASRRYARPSRLALVASLGLIAVFGAGVAGWQATDPTFETVRAKRLVIVDEAGRRCAEIRVDEAGAGALELFGVQTEGGEAEKAYASLSAERGAGQLNLGSVAGSTAATLGATGFGETWGGFLRLTSDDYPVVSMWTQNGTANFQMVDSDEEGGFLCGTRSLSSGRAGWMELRNGQGESALYLLAGENGDGIVELYDGHGEQRTLRAKEEAPSNKD